MGKPSWSIVCTRKQQPRFYWNCSPVVMNDATPLTPPSAWEKLSLSNVNNIHVHSMIPENQKTFVVVLFELIICHITLEHLMIINKSMFEQGNHYLSNIHMIFYQHWCKTYEVLGQFSCIIRSTCGKIWMWIILMCITYTQLSDKYRFAKSWMKKKCNFVDIVLYIEYTYWTNASTWCYRVWSICKCFA